MRSTETRAGRSSTGDHTRYEDTRYQTDPGLPLVLHVCKDGTGWATVRQSVAVVLRAVVRLLVSSPMDAGNMGGGELSRTRAPESRAGQDWAGLD